MFLLELAYGGLFLIENVPEEILQQVLLIEAPHLLFPFARRIVADAVRDGGMPPLMIEPIDFAGLYRAKMAEAQQGSRAAPPRAVPRQGARAALALPQFHTASSPSSCDKARHGRPLRPR